MKALYRGRDGKCNLRNGHLYDIQAVKDAKAKAALVMEVKVDAMNRFLMSYVTLEAFCGEWFLMNAPVAAMPNVRDE